MAARQGERVARAATRIKGARAELVRYGTGAPRKVAISGACAILLSTTMRWSSSSSSSPGQAGSALAIAGNSASRAAKLIADQPARRRMVGRKGQDLACARRFALRLRGFRRSNRQHRTSAKACRSRERCSTHRPERNARRRYRRVAAARLATFSLSPTKRAHGYSWRWRLRVRVLHGFERRQDHPSSSPHPSGCKG